MGSVYVPPNLSGGRGDSGTTRSSCSGGCSSEQQIAYDYIRSYLNAHMLSKPSWRYYYVLWFVLLGLLLLSSAAHFNGVGERTLIGAVWNKWATKNRVIKIGKKPSSLTAGWAHVIPDRRAGRRHTSEQLASDVYAAITAPAVPESYKQRRIITFPSFGRMIVLALMLAIPTCLSLIGADYINPNASTFDISQSFPNGNVTPQNIQTQQRRRSSPSLVAQLARRALQWGQGSFPSVTTLPVNTTIPYRTWWTIGGRLGGMTNALTPFVLLLALKQVPFALLSLKAFGGFAFDRLSFLHKWGGRIVWLFATVHVVTWSVQLGLDRALGGKMLWSLAFMWPRFRWGFVSYIFLTSLVALSVGPLRRKYYEVFYITHIICTVGFMVSAWLHHPPLGPWMYAALLWWLAERITRAAKIAWINGIGFVGAKPQFVPGAGALEPRHFQQQPQPTSLRYSSLYAHQRQNGRMAPPNQLFASRLPFAPSNSEPNYAAAPTLSSSTNSQASGPTGSTRSLSPPWGNVQPQQYQQGRGGLSEGKFPNDPLSQYAAGTEAAGHGCMQPDAGFSIATGPRRPSGGAPAHYDEINNVISAYAPVRKSEYATERYEGHESQHGTQTAQANSNRPAAQLSPTMHRFVGVQLEDGSYPLTAPIGHQDVTSYSDSEHTLVRPPSSTADHYGAAPSGGMHEKAHMLGRGHFSQMRSSGSTSYSSNGSNGASAYDFMSPSQSFGDVAKDQWGQLRRAVRPAISVEVAAALQPGYAFVQLLPGKTLRLTIRTPHHISWLPGQWVNLQIPSVRFWETHPFTIAAAYDAQYPSLPDASLDDAEKGVLPMGKVKGEHRTIVLLLRARNGFTKQLFEYVQQQRRVQLGATLHANAGISKATTGVHLRALIDGAYGSSKRVDWGSHSSIIIVCAGSGVSFGISVLEHLCACIAGRETMGRAGKGGRSFHVKHVRFVWMLREFSHLQWVASALRRCIEMIPPEQLQIDLYVTHFNNQSAVLPLPSPMGPPSELHGQPSKSFSHGHQYRDSWDDATDQASPSPSFPSLSLHGMQQGPLPRQARFTEGPEQEEYELNAHDLTHFDGEDQGSLNPVEMLINDRIRKEGKLRRAHTRKVTMKRKGGRGSANGKVQDSQAMASQRAVYEGWASTGRDGPPMDPVVEGLWMDAKSATQKAMLASPQHGSYGESVSGSSIPISRGVSPVLTPSIGSRGEGMQSEAHLMGEAPLDDACPIDLDEQEDNDMRILAELARPGHPKLDRAIREEIQRSKGPTLVTCCGPTSLSTVIRSIVSNCIDPQRIRSGDTRGYVNVVSESYEWGE